MGRARSTSASSSEDSSEDAEKKKKRNVAEKKAKKQSSSSSDSSSSRSDTKRAKQSKKRSRSSDSTKGDADGSPKRWSAKSRSVDSNKSSRDSSSKRPKKKDSKLKGKQVVKRKGSRSRSSSSSSIKKPVKKKALTKIKGSKNKGSKGKITKAKGKQVRRTKSSSSSESRKRREDTRKRSGRGNKEDRSHLQVSDEEREPANETKELPQGKQADSEAEKSPEEEEIPVTVTDLMMFAIKAKQEWEEKERHSTLGLELEFYTAAISEKFGPDDRFQAKSQIGKGAFSTVYRCTNTMDGRDYAVKIISSHPMKKKVAEWEIQMYKLCATEARKFDPEGSKYLMGMGKPESFMIGDRAHLALVFPLQKCDMKRGMKKYKVGEGKGLLLRAVQLYGRQLFLALRALKTAKVVHCDIRPENILLTQDKGSIVLCDFGSAMSVAEQVCAEDVQPQQYRAPEVILGKRYDTQIDVWSVGATLFELATGQVLFPGKTNNEVLRQMLDVCGSFGKNFPLEFVTSGEFAQKHFDTMGDFILRSGPDMAEDSVVPIIHWARPKTPVSQMFADAVKDAPKGKDPQRHAEKVDGLAEFLGLCLMPDPGERMIPEDALQVPVMNL